MTQEELKKRLEVLIEEATDIRDNLAWLIEGRREELTIRLFRLAVDAIVMRTVVR